jgi:zinc protease
LEPPQVARFQFADGMKLLLLEDHETPIVTAVAMVRTGTVCDPPDRAGLAAVTASLIRSGGARLRSPEQVDAELDSLGATVDINMSEAMGTISLTTLKENLAESLVLFRDLLTSPAFRQNRLDLSRAGYRNSIAARNDDPREVLSREFRAAVHGRDGVLARRAEYATIGRISRADVNAFYRKYFFPANIVLAISGDFNSVQVKDSVEALFAQWKNPPGPAPEFPSMESKPAPGSFLAVRPALNETYFAIGGLGADFKDKDSPALEVATAILGIGPQSRLLGRARKTGGSIREMRADWLPAFPHAGLFFASGVGVSAATGDSVAIVVEEVQRLRSVEATEEELRSAKEAVLVAVSKGFDSKGRALAALASLDFYGYPPDFIQQYQKAIGAVTRADVLRVAKDRLDPDRFTTVAVSSLSVFNKPIHPTGGAPTLIDLTIPAARPEDSKTDTAGLDEGRKLLARAQQAVGGADKLAAIKDFTQTIRYTLSDSSRETETDLWIAPSHMRQEGQASRVGTIIRYSDGTRGWVSDGRASAPLSAAGLRQSTGDLIRIPISMLLSDRVAERKVSAVDEQTIEIAQGDVLTQVVIDPQSGLPAKVLYEAQSDRRLPIYVEEEYSDFRDIGGVKLPHAVKVMRNGLKYSEGVLEYKVNEGLKVEVLQRRP